MSTSLGTSDSSLLDLPPQSAYALHNQWREKCPFACVKLELADFHAVVDSLRLSAYSPDATRTFGMLRPGTCNEKPARHFTRHLNRTHSNGACLTR